MATSTEAASTAAKKEIVNIIPSGGSGTGPKVKTPAGNVPIIPILLIFIGAYLTWFAIHYWGRDLTWPSDPIKSVLQGKGLPDPGTPSTTASVILTSSESAAGSSGSSGGSATGDQIATDASSYAGHCYLYGGAPGTDGKSCWDCSSFCNWVIGHDEQMDIPGYSGGTYDGSSHGPPTGSWMIWTGCRTITRKNVQAGDLLVWSSHMGIALDNSTMISAQSPKNGTVKSQIDQSGPAGEKLTCRRLTALSAKSTGGGSGGSPTQNKNLAKMLLGRFGWSQDQFAPLDNLWTGESGWQTDATNPTSGAYGIPQSLPANKMASAGKDWKTNPKVQIIWGMTYIKARYGSPAKAYDAWLSRSPHWY